MNNETRLFISTKELFNNFSHSTLYCFYEPLTGPTPINIYELLVFHATNNMFDEKNGISVLKFCTSTKLTLKKFLASITILSEFRLVTIFQKPNKNILFLKLFQPLSPKKIFLSTEWITDLKKVLDEKLIKKYFQKFQLQNPKKFKINEFVKQKPTYKYNSLILNEDKKQNNKLLLSTNQSDSNSNATINNDNPHNVARLFCLEQKLQTISFVTSNVVRKNKQFFLQLLQNEYLNVDSVYTIFQIFSHSFTNANDKISKALIYLKFFISLSNSQQQVLTKIHDNSFRVPFSEFKNYPQIKIDRIYIHERNSIFISYPFYFPNANINNLVLISDVLSKYPLQSGVANVIFEFSKLKSQSFQLNYFKKIAITMYQKKIMLITEAMTYLSHAYFASTVKNNKILTDYHSDSLSSLSDTTEFKWKID